MNQYFEEKGRTEEAPLFRASYDEAPYHGIRWNRLKVLPESYVSHMQALGLSSDDVTWCPGGYYTPDISLGKDPYYHAGAAHISRTNSQGRVPRTEAGSMADGS